MNELPVARVNVISGAPRPVLERCLAGLNAARVAASAHARVVGLFIDNSGSGVERWVAQAYPWLEYFAQPRPRGFATNANLALRQDADYTLLLNNDAFLREDTLLRLLDALDRHPRWAAVSAHLQNPDGSDQGTAFDFPGWRSVLCWLAGARRVYSLHGRQRAIASEEVEADWAPATCFLLRRAAVQSIGLFDETFDPGYAEDVDWCRRARNAGWQVGVCAEARVVHLGGASFNALGARRFALFVNGLCRYFRKHHSPLSARALALLIGVGLLAGSARPRADVAYDAATRRHALLAGAQVAFMNATKTLA